MGRMAVLANISRLELEYSGATGWPGGLDGWAGWAGWLAGWVAGSFREVTKRGGWFVRRLGKSWRRLLGCGRERWREVKGEVEGGGPSSKRQHEVSGNCGLRRSH